MNVKAAFVAAGGGVLALCSFAAAFFVFFFSMVLGGGFSLFGSAEYSTLGLLGMFALAPGIAAVGGAVPARVLGAPWPRSVLASSVPVGTFFFGVYGTLINSKDQLPIWQTPAAVVGAVVVTLVGSVSVALNFKGIVAVLSVAAALLVAAVSLSLGGFWENVWRDDATAIVIALAWVSLPALAGAFLPSDEQEGERTR